MTKKRLFVITGFLVACFVTLGVLALLPARPGLTKANYDRVPKGMTSAEVEAIFGRPPDRIAEQEEAAFFSWATENGESVTVCFDAKRHVIGKSWIERERETLPQKIRRWLRLP